MLEKYLDIFSLYKYVLLCLLCVCFQVPVPKSLYDVSEKNNKVLSLKVCVSGSVWNLANAENVFMFQYSHSRLCMDMV